MTRKTLRPTARALLDASKPRTILVARGIRHAGPRERSSRRLAVLVAAATLAAAPHAAKAGSPGFLTKCPLTHSAMDDPIKFPGQPGASHLHDFFANRSTDAFSSYASMVAAGTTCGTAGDTAGYWAPALYRNGVKINPAGSFNGRSTREQFYYRDNDVTAGTTIEPFPPNFKMIQGYATAKSVADANAHGAEWGGELYWGCSDNSPDGKFTAPINCATGIITLHVGFPDCWDGVMVAGDEIAAGHVKFPSGYKCPAGFNHHLPRLQERFEYPVGKSSSGISLSSGAYYTFHADFLNAWQQSKLTSLVNNCLNKDVDCGTDPK